VKLLLGLGNKLSFRKKVSWTPSELADGRCWLDASDANTITLSGSSITKWDDKIGSNFADDAVNSSNEKITTARPTIVTTAQNGLDAVGFNGSQWFDHNTARGMLRNRSHALVAVVSKTPPDPLGMFWSNSDTGMGGGYRLFFDMDGNGYRVLSTNDDDEGYEVNLTTQLINDSDWHIHTISLNFAGNIAEYFLDGSTPNYSVNNNSYGGGKNTNDTDHGTEWNVGTAIGSFDRGGQNFKLANGARIGEMICGAKSSGSYDVSDRQKLEGYLAHKWGLTSNLPNDHPYKTTSP